MVVVVLVSRCAHMQGRRHVRMLCITQILHSVSHGPCPTGEYSRPMGVGALRKVGGGQTPVRETLILISLCGKFNRYPYGKKIEGSFELLLLNRVLL